MKEQVWAAHQQNPYLSKGGGFSIDALLTMGIPPSKFRKAFELDTKGQISALNDNIISAYFNRTTAL